jgi:hypothetical protein
MGVHARPRESAQGAQKAAVTDVIHGPLVMPTSPDLLALYQRFDRLMDLALADQQAELESLKKSGDPFALQLEGMLIYHRHQSPTESLFSVDELVSAVKAELPWKIASDVSSDNLVTRDVALIRERNERDNVPTVYWSPKRPNEWGSVEIRFEWNTDSNPALAIFEPSLHVFGDYDATAAGELAVSSEATGNRWVDLAALGPGRKKFSLQSAIDVTRWVQGSQSIRIRYRVKAGRLMYHPTPNDPIGLATAQCLRQFDPVNGYSARLQFWTSRPNGE